MRRLALVVLLAAAPALSQDQSAQDQAEQDRGVLTGLIEDNLSSTARQVVIEGFEGALSTRATVARLTIADAEGVWLDARDLTDVLAVCDDVLEGRDGCGPGRRTTHLGGLEPPRANGR